MKNTQRLVILLSKVQKSDIPYKEQYIEALEDGIKSIKIAERKEILAAVIVGIGFAVGLAIIGYFTYLIK